ncbi:hypothetical protein J6590_005624 [Homalodisca vitripennis]|nr:hypothetical protein J6590_005624 [Homalodisca vitripennis]
MVRLQNMGFPGNYYRSSPTASIHIQLFIENTRELKLKYAHLGLRKNSDDLGGSCSLHILARRVSSKGPLFIAINLHIKVVEIEDRAAVVADDVLIEEIDSTKFLGLYLERSLTWDDHIESTCSKVSSGNYALRNLSKFCSRGVLKMAYFGLGAWIANFALSLHPHVALYCRFKCELVRGRDVHQYGTRGRDNLRLYPHRTAAFKRLPSEVGVKLINKLPDEIKDLNEPTKFKSRLRHFLVSRVYSVQEFYGGPLGLNLK